MKKVFSLSTVVISAALCVAQTPTQPTPAAPADPAQTTAGLATPTSAAPLVREIRGTVKAGNAPLPGVTVTAANTITGKKVATSTDLDGSYVLTLPSNGRYVVKAELAAFAPATQETVINAATPTAKIDISMQLASRVQQTDLGTQIAQAAQAMGVGTAGGRGGMQSLGLNAGDSASFAANSGNSGGANADSSAGASLPFNAGGDSSSESVSVSGQMGRVQGAISQDELQDRIAEMRDRMQQGGGPGGNIEFRGGPGGGGPMGGPGIMIIGGPGGIGAINKLNVNRPHGTLYYNAGNSIFDAKPYSLTGAGTAKPEYDQGRFGAFVGGPLIIPHIYNGGMKTLFFAGYNGSIVSNPYDAFSTVPTLLERGGDFSQSLFTSGPNKGLPVQLFNPVTHAPIPGNNISALISSQSKSLLNFIPLPNLPGNTQNFHYVTSTDNNVQSFNARVIHNFGDVPNFLQQLGGRGGRGGGGGNGRRRGTTNLNVGFNYNHVTNDIANPLPTLGGTSEITGMNANVGFNWSRGRLNNNLNASYNRSHSDTLNKYAFKQDVAGQAGIGGVSTDPFDFGVPGLSFTNFRSLNDIASSDRLNQTFTIGDGMGWTRGKHSLRFGGDFRRIYNDIRADQNARGSFTFTGVATSLTAIQGTGFDFADFLVGLPQLTSIQAGTLHYDLRGNSWDVYGQDEWRLRSNLTLNLGLRYEYVSPFSEAKNRLVNLDVAPGFTAVAPVQPGQVGPFTGPFPSGLTEPDRNNWAPRIGIAYKPFKNTVVRSGYGINYNLGQYAAMAQQLAFQPPFAFTQTNITSLAAPLTLANGFPASTATTTNNYAVDRNYNLAYVQTWNLDIQQEIHRSIVLNVGYNGSKGTDLDIVRAPNRTPTGLRIPGVQPFNFESSQGSSTLHALNVRARQRLRHGISLQGQYVFSKSIDNASSIGGGGTVVAQNDLDLAAERGLSSFYQKHRFTGSYIYELPFGPGKKFLGGDTFLSKLTREWQISGDWTLASGTPFTPRVIGGFAEVAGGTTGTLRANVTGEPIQLDHPTVQQFFNTAAFVLPPQGQFGDARRNSIIGPGLVQFDMAVSKNITLKDFQALEFRASATNVFNHVHFTSIDTTVNSPTYGQIISAGAMRRMQLSARYRF